MTPLSPESPKNQSDVSSTENTQKIFGQALLIGLVGLLFLSFSFFYYVWKQNSEFSFSLNELSEKQKTAENFNMFFNSIIGDLSNYSRQHPEIATILASQGIAVQQSAPKQNQPMPPLPLPPPPGQ